MYLRDKFALPITNDLKLKWLLFAFCVVADNEPYSMCVAMYRTCMTPFLINTYLKTEHIY